MPARLPARPDEPRRFAPARYEVPVGVDWSPVRAIAIWPIAATLGADEQLAAAFAAPGSAAASCMVLDLVDSGMIAPPRQRRRRERPVSSRAVFYQSADA
ncbi:MAG: hypothetical protein ACKOZU_00795 [Planctomycetaceae bacterium]